jgi:uncharacterized delta-60 repeat protein
MNNKNRIENIYEKALMCINKMHFLIAVITISGLFLLAMPSPIEAAPGDLDPTFGSGGKVITPFGTDGAALAVAVQSDGKIVAVGPSNSGTTSAPNYDFALVRYNTDGSLDSSFGTDGKVATDLGGIREVAWGVALQPDGKIVVAGESGSSTTIKDFALARYNTNGTLDSSFGTGGKVITPVSSLADGAGAVAIQSDGKIVAAGYSNSGTASAVNRDFTLLRYNANGTLDNSFGVGGKVITDFGSSIDDQANAMAIQSDGKIIAVGKYGLDSSAGTDYALARYNMDGSLDTSFGTGGKVLTSVANYDEALAVAIQADGKFVVAGISHNGANNDFSLVRYNTNGSLDNSFGTGGKVITAIGSGDDKALAVAIQSNGKIVVAGDSNSGTSTAPNYDFAVVRYNTDGTLDSSFGAGGKVITPISNRNDFVYAATIQADGKIIVAGSSSTAFALVRYLGDPVAARNTLFDFDGDGKADVSVFRPENGTWYLNQSTNGFAGIQFGASTDKIVPADYDGDGKTDVAVYRDGTWYLQRSRDGIIGIAFGVATDIPMPADFNGDGKAEIAVFRPSNGGWYIYNLTNNQVTSVQFGQAGDVPVAADYDGDGKSDIAVYRNGTWYLQRSQLGFTGIAFGESTDKPVAADYDGDGKADVAVFRPSNGTWYLQRSQLGFTGIAFGLGSDLTVPADYDGDGKADVAVFRNGTWYIQRSQSGFTGVAFGAPTDKPAPNAFIP